MFVGSNVWFGVLISIHVVGAVVGLGPTFAFAIMGPLAGKVSPEGGLGIMEAMDKIEWRIVNPILLTIQPATGALLIWNRGLNHNFFTGDRAWLIGGIGAYLAATIIALGIMDPALKSMIRMAKGGQGGTPEFGALAKRSATFGPILTVLGLTIVVLMIWKPGSGCTYQC
jgi:predicted integral membrane protein DUF2269